MQKIKRKQLYTFIKISISLALLYAVLIQIDWDIVKLHWKTADLFWVVIGIVCYLISQIVSTFRMQLFLRAIKINISHVNALRIYALGMFYNLFIPGGIGGDAYKIIHLKKHFSHSYQSIAKAIFLDRLVGLGAIVILILFGLTSLPIYEVNKYQLLILVIAFTSLLLFPLLFGLMFKKFKPVSIVALGLSFVIQAFQIGTILAGMYALGLKINYILYAVIFLISSILSIISFAGIGIREAFFFYVSKYASVNPDLSATLAIYFSLVTIFVSFFGIIYTLKKIKL